jgi:hypothetical protein
MSTGKHLASILVLTLFIITTINIEEKSIQQHGKGYIVVFGPGFSSILEAWSSKM